MPIKPQKVLFWTNKYQLNNIANGGVSYMCFKTFKNQNSRKMYKKKELCLHLAFNYISNVGSNIFLHKVLLVGEYKLTNVINNL